MGILLVGASGLARETVPVLHELGHEVVGVLNDRWAELGDVAGNIPVLGGIDEVLQHAGARIVVTVGSSGGRSAVVRRLAALGVDDDRFLAVVDPSVRNPAECPVGTGLILLAGVTITADASLGRHVVAMPGVTITHDCVVEDEVTFAAGVSLGGGARVGRGAYLGMNASVHPGVTIGQGAIVGMGAVVLSDVPDGETWAGVPARSLRGQL
ncbi:NeuD/PglB/VioB family sugar acetyltransferase [Salana multivorans]